MSPLLCRRCCRHVHKWLPFHRIQRWNGQFFCRAALWEVGCRLLVIPPSGHCAEISERIFQMDRAELEIDKVNRNKSDSPAENVDDLFNITAKVGSIDLSDFQPDEQDDPGDDDTWNEELEQLESQDGPPREDGFGNPFITVIDTSGFHTLPLVVCNCSSIQENVRDCLAAGLFAASFRQISTLVTTHCLEEFRLSNLECKTTNYQYHNFLRRKTNAAFPKSIPSRYAEMRRLSRQWRILKKEKWHGTWAEEPVDSGEEHQAEQEQGNPMPPRKSIPMGIFCAACPQPYVNLPPNWQEDINR